MSDLGELLTRIRACRICADELPRGPRPVVVANEAARVLIAGQAPGRRVHDTGIPWNDPSGDRLRTWLGVTREQFYEERDFALIPMGFCYPGRTAAGDAPPRPECAPAWQQELLSALPGIRLTLAVGRYSQAYHLGARARTSVTETVRAWREYGEVIPLPHPSPRNIAWFGRNPWFEAEVVPDVRERVHRIVGLV